MRGNLSIHLRGPSGSSVVAQVPGIVEVTFSIPAEPCSLGQHVSRGTGRILLQRRQDIQHHYFSTKSLYSSRAARI